MKKLILFLVILTTAIYLNAGKIGGLEEKTVVFSEVFIENNDINDFCKTTLIPMLRNRNFKMHINVLELHIEKEYGKWTLCFNIANWGCLENNELPPGYQEGFCMIDKYPMKVEYPASCPFIRIGNKRLSLMHQEGILGVDGCISWCYFLKNGKLVPDRFWGLWDYKVVEGKTLNQSTGRLE